MMMKKTFTLFFSAIVFSSCDFILKEREATNETDLKQPAIVLGTDVDDRGCVVSAGYMWSEVRDTCIRVFEEGYRLAPIHQKEIQETQDDTFVDANKKSVQVLNAYVVFNEDKSKAELFLPNAKKSVLLESKSNQTIYSNGDWTLNTSKSYTLKKGVKVVYTSAIAVEQKFTGSTTSD